MMTRMSGSAGQTSPLVIRRVLACATVSPPSEKFAPVKNRSPRVSDGLLKISAWKAGNSARATVSSPPSRLAMIVPSTVA